MTWTVLDSLCPGVRPQIEPLLPFKGAAPPRDEHDAANMVNSGKCEEQNLSPAAQTLNDFVESEESANLER